MRGGGAKAVWNFPKKSSDLVAGPFPYSKDSAGRFYASAGVQPELHNIRRR